MVATHTGAVLGQLLAVQLALYSIVYSQLWEETGHSPLVVWDGSVGHSVKEKQRT